MFFSLFIFLCSFPLCFPVVLPYCGPYCTTPSLGRSPRANRWKNWWLRTRAHLQKKIKNLWFSFFLRFMYRHYFKAITWNKKVNIFLFFFHFIFLCYFPFFSPLCFSIGVPVVLPRCSPHCGATGTAEATGNCSHSFSTNARARWRKTLTPTRCIGITAPGRHNGRHNGETKRETKWKNENEKR